MFLAPLKDKYFRKAWSISLKRVTGWDYRPVVEHLLSICKVPAKIPSITKKNFLKISLRTEVYLKC
jgi:hypothetical protein